MINEKRSFVLNQLRGYIVNIDDDYDMGLKHQLLEIEIYTKGLAGETFKSCSRICGIPGIFGKYVSV